MIRAPEIQGEMGGDQFGEDKMPEEERKGKKKFN